MAGSMDELYERLLSCAAEGVMRSQPNVLSEALEPGQATTHTAAAATVVHPAFFGCYDWHSAVHSHWLMVRILRTTDHLHADLRKQAIAILDEHLTAENMGAESVSIAENDESWEMPYGMCWLLLLAKELQLWASVQDAPNWATSAGCTHEQRRVWSSAVALLATAIVRPRVTDWLHGLVVPNCSGAHRNTAFSLCTLLDACRGDPLEPQIIQVAGRLFGGDTDARDPRPVDSRGRAAFLSPSVCTSSTHVSCKQSLANITQTSMRMSHFFRHSSRRQI
eukprot:COSAG02_NODE_1823_length_10761_cov_32.341868_4_plen_279_part_00